jgi:hypothetical protein
MKYDLKTPEDVADHITESKRAITEWGAVIMLVDVTRTQIALTRRKRDKILIYEDMLKRIEQIADYQRSREP